MTDLEVLEDAVSTIGSIKIPIALVDPVGVPLKRVCNNLLVLVDAVKRNAENKTTENDSDGAVEDTPEN